MLFDKFYLTNYQPPVEMEVKCNGAQIKVPVKSVNIMVYSLVYGLFVILLCGFTWKMILKTVNLPKSM